MRAMTSTSHVSWPVELHDDFLGIVIFMGVSQDGVFGHVKQCIVNAFDPNLAMSATEATHQILSKPKHLDNPSFAIDLTLPHVTAFLAGY
jgi:hypothetical protein